MECLPVAAQPSRPGPAKPSLGRAVPRDGTAEQQGRDVLETIKTLLKIECAGQDITLLTD